MPLPSITHFSKEIQQPWNFANGERLRRESLSRSKLNQRLTLLVGVLCAVGSEFVAQFL